MRLCCSERDEAHSLQPGRENGTDDIRIDVNCKLEVHEKLLFCAKKICIYSDKRREILYSRKIQRRNTRL